MRLRRGRAQAHSRCDKYLLASDLRDVNTGALGLELH